MSNEITSQSGRAVGIWDGADVTDLRQELDRIRQLLRDADNGDRLVTSGVPHRDQLPQDLHTFSAYPIWGCDSQQNCLCGARANRVVSVTDVRQYSLIDHH